VISTTLPERWIAIDTETTGLNRWRGDRPFCIGVWLPNGTKQFYWRDDMERMRDTLADPSIDKVFANAKFDLRMLEAAGFVVRGRVWDIFIFAHLLDGRDSNNISLDFISKKYLPSSMRKITAEIDDWFKANPGANPKDKDFSRLSKDLVEKRCTGDAELTGAFFRKVYSTVAKLFPFLLEQEHRLLLVVKKMEDRGVRIDQSEIERQYDYFNEIVEEVIDWFECYEGRYYFSLTSRTDQLAAVNRAGIADLLIDTDPDTKKERMFLDDYHLRNTHHPVAHMLLVGKAAMKMRDTFLGQMERLATDGVLHPSYNQIGTSTGRFSCSAPNLQNIPIEGDRRTAYTEAEADEMIDMTGINYAPHVKRIFPVRDGYAHMHTDKKQAEMVMLAHYTNDPIMKAIFQRGESIHDGICRMLYGEWTKGLKTRTKAVVFGYQYGAGLPTIAKKIGGTIDDARKAKAKLETTFPSLPRWRRELNERITELGFVQTIHGRRHYIHMSDAYKAVNYMCQGSVGDEIKNRMIAIDDYMTSGGHDGRVVMNIHDDIVTEFPKHEAQKHSIEIARIMNEAGADYRLPLPSSADITYTRWADLHEIKDMAAFESEWSPSILEPKYRSKIAAERTKVHA
jgi:DNA polymerase-1